MRRAQLRLTPMAPPCGSDDCSRTMLVHSLSCGLWTIALHALSLEFWAHPEAQQRTTLTGAP